MADDRPAWLAFGDFHLDVAQRELRRRDQVVDLNARGMALLLELLSEAGQPVSKERLIKAAWGSRQVEASNLTVQIAALRRQLAGGPDQPAPIRTQPGYGYVFTLPVQLGPSPGKAAGAPAAPQPRLRTWRDAPLTALIGRETERRDLARLLHRHRMVTLSGFGGVGKTRLALRLMSDLASAYADGTTFVDLAPLAEPGQVAEAVAVAVGAGSGETEALAALSIALHDRRHLLVLDNAEHLAPAVAALLVHVLATAPLVSALVTSRDSLGLPGEVVFRLSPLDLPPASPELTAEQAMRHDSIRLLVDRAQALLPGYVLADSDAPQAAAICRRLDGIALAIEMAVPRLEVLTMRQLAERLKDRFATLAPLRHSALPRQRTLRAMFDWSWDLLSASEQRLLQLLAISVGGTTLDALESLAAADGILGSEDVLQSLARLTQSSLVIVGNGFRMEPRYRVLETTRQYALEQMAPERLHALSRLYALEMAATFEGAEAAWPVTHGASWLGRYGPEVDNLRWTLSWAFGQPDEKGLALRLTAASFSLWWELPELPLREARNWYATALASVGPDTPVGVEARLRLGQVWTDTVDGDVENYGEVSRAVALFRLAKDRVGLGAALWRAAGTVISRENMPSATALLAEAAQVLDGQRATKWQALCAVREADLLANGGALAAALEKYTAALTTLRDLGHAYGILVAGGNRSYVLFELGRSDEAVAALRDLRAALPPGLGHSLLSLLAITLASAGRDDDARACALEGLGGTASLGMGATLARSIEALALLAGRAGDPAAAARLAGFVFTRHPPERLRLGPRRVVFEHLRAMLSTTLPRDTSEALLEEGARWTEAEAIAAAVRADAA